MDYIPHTADETQRMLSAVGLNNPSELFHMIPSAFLDPEIEIPTPVTEMEIVEEMEKAAQKNEGGSMVSFLGGGAYDHFVPRTVNALISRGDFYTAYTPYQAEASQGTLQAIYEFQTLLSRLTGMEAANASMYDGASALAEAALMACRVRRKSKILVSAAVNPQYRRVLRTYLEAQAIELIEIPHTEGITDLGSLKETIDADTAAFFVSQPNYFGIFEPVDSIAEIVNHSDALLGASVYPHSLGLLKSPGEWGADIVSGDLQSLGLALNYGGPYAGILAAKQKYIRQMPGRLAGRAKDRDGNPGFTLTLQTREQHIRRAKATSNICTNQALCALASTVYLTLMGSKGLRSAAERSARNAHALKDHLCKINGVRLRFDRPFFNEFVIELPIPIQQWLDKASEENILAGIPISGAETGSKEALLVCATEKTNPVDIDRYSHLLSKMIG